MSRRLRPHAATAGGLMKTPPRCSQSSGDGRHAAPSQALWYIAPSLPRPKTSRRLLPHDATAGGLVKTPPSRSQSSGDGAHEVPVHALGYIAPSVPTPKMSRRFWPHAVTQVVLFGAGRKGEIRLPMTSLQTRQNGTLSCCILHVYSGRKAPQW